MEWIWIGILIGIGLMLAPLVLMVALGAAGVLLKFIVAASLSLWRLVVLSVPVAAGGVLGLAVDLARGAPPYSVTILGGLLGLGVALYLSERKLSSKG